MGKLLKCITNDGAAVIIAADTTDVVSRAENIHKSSAVVTAALGRLLTAASIMGSMIKNPNGSVTLRVKGDGAVMGLTVVSDSNGNVRGYPVQNVVELPLNPKGKLDVGGAVGRGTLTVIRDDDKKEPYIGSVQLVSGEIAEDITAYYAISEQIPTVCSLGVLVNPDLSVRKAGGFILQLLPGADDNTITMVENAVKKLRSMTQMLDDSMSLMQICKAALDGFEIEVLEEKEVYYHCPCSKDRVEKALISCGREDLLDMAKDDKTEMCCQFCDKKYVFTSQDILKLAKK